MFAVVLQIKRKLVYSFWKILYFNGPEIKYIYVFGDCGKMWMSVFYEHLCIYWTGIRYTIFKFCQEESKACSTIFVLHTKASWVHVLCVISELVCNELHSHYILGLRI